MLEEAKSVLLQHRGMVMDEAVEDGVVGLLVSQGHEERAYHLHVSSHDRLHRTGATTFNVFFLFSASLVVWEGFFNRSPSTDN